MPSLQELHNHFRNDQFVLLPISVEETSDIVKKYMEKHSYTMDVLLDEDGSTSARYDVRNHPKKVLIDPAGNIVGTAVGYREWDSAAMKSLIRLLFKARKQPESSR